MYSCINIILRVTELYQTPKRKKRKAPWSKNTKCRINTLTRESEDIRPISFVSPHFITSETQSKPWKTTHTWHSLTLQREKYSQTQEERRKAELWGCLTDREAERGGGRQSSSKLLISVRLASSSLQFRVKKCKICSHDGKWHRTSLNQSLQKVTLPYIGFTQDTCVAVKQICFSVMWNVRKTIFSQIR